MSVSIRKLKRDLDEVGQASRSWVFPISRFPITAFLPPIRPKRSLYFRQLLFVPARSENSVNGTAYDERSGIPFLQKIGDNTSPDKIRHTRSTVDRHNIVPHRDCSIGSIVRPAAAS
jgi:hypothetical protein